jgi:hypothetical protein
MHNGVVSEHGVGFFSFLLKFSHLEWDGWMG